MICLWYLWTLHFLFLLSYMCYVVKVGVRKTCTVLLILPRAVAQSFIFSPSGLQQPLAEHFTYKQNLIGQRSHYSSVYLMYWICPWCHLYLVWEVKCGILNKRKADISSSKWWWAIWKRKAIYSVNLSIYGSVQFSSVQSLSRVQLLATP